ncbi:MAG: DNA primase family protein [Limnohabitans sp.]
MDSDTLNPGSTIESEQDIAKKVEARAAELLPGVDPDPLDPLFIKSCLDGNERGDGCLAATLFKDRFLLNVTRQAREPEWYYWHANVWKMDVFRESLNAVEECAQAYAGQAMHLDLEVKEKKIDKKHPDYGWKVRLRDKYTQRVDKLRTEAGMKKALSMAAIVDKTLACEETDFNHQPWLLPAANGVINLKTGALIKGNPADRMTKSLAVDYDPRADYRPFLDFMHEVSGSADMVDFQKRSFGCACTGFSLEQYLWIYIGPGRNGKGVLFNLIADVLGPYYHEISRAMILEQRNEPSANAASEHKYSLLHKRMIVAAETNKGQKIDGAAIKALTGQNHITCRPNFSSEISFFPTHSTFLQTNNFPTGLTRGFSLAERMLIIEFPYMFVDDPDEMKRKFPVLAEKFRKKDPKLYEKLSEFKPGILRWMVEGCLEWQQIGLKPPPQVLDRVAALAKEEDYVGRFIEDCMDLWPDRPEVRVHCSVMYEVFKFWCSENSEWSDKALPHMKTVTKQLREKGYEVIASGGRTYVHRMTIKLDVVGSMQEPK